jgi:hypothetical protein
MYTWVDFSGIRVMILLNIFTLSWFEIFSVLASAGVVLQAICILRAETCSERRRLSTDKLQQQQKNSLPMTGVHVERYGTWR